MMILLTTGSFEPAQVVADESHPEPARRQIEDSRHEFGCEDVAGPSLEQNALSRRFRSRNRWIG